MWTEGVGQVAAVGSGQLSMVGCNSYNELAAATSMVVVCTDEEENAAIATAVQKGDTRRKGGNLSHEKNPPPLSRRGIALPADLTQPGGKEMRSRGGVKLRKSSPALTSLVRRRTNKANTADHKQSGSHATKGAAPPLRSDGADYQRPSEAAARVGDVDGVDGEVTFRATKIVAGHAGQWSCCGCRTPKGSPVVSRYGFPEHIVKFVKPSEASFYLLTFVLATATDDAAAVYGRRYSRRQRSSAGLEGPNTSPSSASVNEVEAEDGNQEDSLPTPAAESSNSIAVGENCVNSNGRFVMNRKRSPSSTSGTPSIPSSSTCSGLHLSRSGEISELLTTLPGVSFEHRIASKRTELADTRSSRPPTSDDKNGERHGRHLSRHRKPSHVSEKCASENGTATRNHYFLKPGEAEDCASSLWPCSSAGSDDRSSSPNSVIHQPHDDVRNSNDDGSGQQRQDAESQEVLNLGNCPAASACTSVAIISKGDNSYTGSVGCDAGSCIGGANGEECQPRRERAKDCYDSNWVHDETSTYGNSVYDDNAAGDNYDEERGDDVADRHGGGTGGGEWRIDREWWTREKLAEWSELANFFPNCLGIRTLQMPPSSPSDARAKVATTGASSRTGALTTSHDVSSSVLNFETSTSPTTTTPSTPMAPMTKAKTLGVVNEVTDCLSSVDWLAALRDRGLTHEVALENLTAHCRSPCVMDVKMGTRYDVPSTSPSRRAILHQRAKTSTSGTLGLRIAGMRGIDWKTGQSVELGRDIRKHDLSAVTRILTGFISFAHPRRRRQLARQFLARLDEMRRWFAKQRLCVFRQCSVLLVFDSFHENDVIIAAAKDKRLPIAFNLRQPPTHHQDDDNDGEDKDITEQLLRKSSHGCRHRRQRLLQQHKTSFAHNDEDDENVKFVVNNNDSTDKDDEDEDDLGRKRAAQWSSAKSDSAGTTSNLLCIPMGGRGDESNEGRGVTRGSRGSVLLSATTTASSESGSGADDLEEAFAGTVGRTVSSGTSDGDDDDDEDEEEDTGVKIRMIDFTYALFDHRPELDVDVEEGVDGRRDDDGSVDQGHARHADGRSSCGDDVDDASKSASSSTTARRTPLDSGYYLGLSNLVRALRRLTTNGSREAKQLLLLQEPNLETFLHP